MDYMHGVQVKSLQGYLGRAEVTSILPAKKWIFHFFF